MAHVVSVCSSINVGRGGLTNALMLRASFLADVGEQVRILTLDRQANFKLGDDFASRVEKVRAAGKLSDNVSVENFFVDTKSRMKGEDLLQAQAQWVNAKTQSGDVVFTDERKWDGVVRLIEGGRKKIGVVHMNHHSERDEPPFKVNHAYDSLLKDNPFDLLAILTPQQIADMHSQGYDTTKCRVMPNSFVDPLRSPMGKRKNYVCSMARYQSQKRLEHAIGIIALVRKSIPDVVYDIFGRGPDEDHLREEVERLGVSDNVFIRGYTTDPKAILSAAQCSLMTSRHEGLPLTIIDSLACGTPVISYDIKYGPKFAITDGVNGFLVAPGDMEHAAEHVRVMLTYPTLSEKMADNALESAKRFSKAIYQREWAAMLEEVRR